MALVMQQRMVAVAVRIVFMIMKKDLLYLILNLKEREISRMKIVQVKKKNEFSDK